jgi:hypothetical protein
LGACCCLFTCQEKQNRETDGEMEEKSRSQGPKQPAASRAESPMRRPKPSACMDPEQVDGEI